jgi:hypothetical protein
VRRHADHLDDFVQSAILVYLADLEKVPTRTLSSGQPDVRSRIDALRVRIDSLEDKYASDEISRAGYLRKRDQFRKQLADLERSAPLSRLPGPLAGVTPGSWWSLSLERKHAVIGSLLKIEVQPTTKRRFDETAIKITPNY